MKKRILALILGVVMTASLLTACGNGDTVSEEKESSGEKHYKIGVVQILEHLSLNTIRDSIVKQLKDSGFDDSNTEIILKNAQNDMSNMNMICNQFVSEKVDMIIAIATPSAQSAMAVTTDIPIVFSAVTDPVAAKIVENPEKPEANITGTSDLIPVDQMFMLCKKLTPDVKRFGFLYSAGEDNSVSVIEEAKKYADNNNFTYEDKKISEISDLEQAITSLKGKVDAIFIPIDNTIASAMEKVKSVANEMKIPVYVAADSMVSDGGFAAVGINYEDLGKETANMAVKILNGAAVSEVPVKYMDNFKTYINTETAASLGINIPDEIKNDSSTVLFPQK